MSKWIEIVASTIEPLCILSTLMQMNWSFLQYTVAMVGYGPEDKNCCNYGITEYDKGNAYAQIAIGTDDDDVYKTAEAVKLFVGHITREPGPLPNINTKITTCFDPDGWQTVFVDNVDFIEELQ
ncbi:probable lactoylglutathione lyase, chloroplastic [Tanacetum coccineum]